MARPKTTAESSGEMIPESKTPPESAVVTSTEAKPTAALDKRIEAILLCFPTYESLYIDQHGGTYSPATPAALRGAAVLYSNPYYEPQKRKK
ncbi:hypothetical protein [Alistipes timonensis]